MNAKISMLLLFAVAALLQPSICVPTHRIARGIGEDFTSKIQEYINRFSSGPGSSEVSTSESASITSAETPETPAGSESAASEPEASIAAKDGSSSPPSGFNYQTYMPSQISGFNPGQYAQYPNQLPNNFNPSTYFPGGSSSSGAAAGSASAASEPEASIAAKDGSSSPPSGFNYQTYMPSQISGFNPGQYAQYPNQLPNNFNPSTYFPGGSSSSGAAAGSASAASEPEASIAAKDGSSSPPSGFNYQTYMPSQISGFNPGQYAQYPNQLPNNFNPSTYFPGGSSSSGAAAGSASAASEPEASIAAKDGSSSPPSGFNYQTYMPSQISGFNPGQYAQYPNQLPNNFNPSTYFPGGSSSSGAAAGSASAASEPEASIAAKDGSSSPPSGFNYQTYMPSQISGFNPGQYAQYPNQLPNNFNPSTYFPGGSSSSGAAAGSASAASEPEASIAAKDGSSSPPSGFNYQTYMPSQISGFNPGQYAQYPNQLPNNFNPSTYFPGGSSSSGAAAGSASAASEPEASIAAKDGSSSPPSGFNYQTYMPSQISGFNPGQYAQYPNQLPNNFNPNSYFPGGSSASSSAASGSSSA